MKKINFVLKEFFYIISAAIVFFVIIELIWPRLILAYFNISWLLIFWLIIGILILIVKVEEE